MAKIAVMMAIDIIIRITSVYQGFLMIRVTYSVIKNIKIQEKDT